MKKIVGFVILLSFPMILFSQKVETVVSSGLDLSQISVFSSNGKILAKSSYSEISVWFVKTGRLIKKIKLDPTFAIDSIEFNESDDQLIAYKMSSNDKAEIDIFSGEIKTIKGGPINYSKIDSEKIKKSTWYKVTTHLSEKKPGYISFKTCQKNVEVRYRNKTENKASHMIEVSLKYNDGFEVVLNDLGIVYGNFCFSKNKRFIYANGVIYDLEKRRVHSKLKSIDFSGSGVMFSYKSHIPITGAKDFLIQWSFPSNNKVPVKNMANLIKLNDTFAGCLLYDLNDLSTSFKVINTITGEQVGQIIEFENTTYHYTLDSTANWLIVKFSNSAVHVYDLKTGQLIKDYGKVEYKDLVCFGEPNQVLYLSADRISYKTDLKSQAKLEYKIEGLKTDETSYFTFQQTEDFFFKPYFNGSTKVWNKKSGNLVHDFKNFMVPGDILTRMSPDGTLIAFFNGLGDVRIHNFSDGKEVSSFHAANGSVMSSDISFDNKYLIVSTLTGEIKYFELATGKELLSLVVAGSNDYLIKSPDNYYFSTKNATDYIHFKKGKEIFTFEQFDLKFNRPDKILAKLDYVDPVLIKAYHKAYLKRLKKMDFTEEMLKNDFHLPKIKIKNLDQMPLITDSVFLDLNLHMEDEKYKLNRVNVWVNDVAVYGVDGVSLLDFNTQKLSKNVHINLIRGYNKIQVSVLNQAGVESFKETFSITCNGGKTKSNLYLIAIGESKFKSSEFNLTYAAKDALDLTNLLKNSKVYQEVKYKTIINENATKSNILELKSFLKDADINDQVMVFFAGHGVLDEELNYFLATYDIDFENPKEKGLAYEYLEGVMDGIKPLKKMLFLDACHSGEIDKDELELMSENVVENENIQFRAVGNAIQRKMGISNSAELSKSLFTDLRKGTGTTVVSSASGVELAMESDEWKNGLFTYCMLKGISSMQADLNKDGEIWLSELQVYVGGQVELLSNGKQKPTSRIENNVMDYRIW